MKKTYITPEALTVVLGSIRMIADSGITNGGNASVNYEEGTEGDVKESKNVWDEEW